MAREKLASHHKLYLDNIVFDKKKKKIGPSCFSLNSSTINRKINIKFIQIL